jgi:MFS family permease
MWWKRAEQPLRLSIWYTSCGFGGLLGSMLVYGIGHIHGSLRQWKYQYLILGAATIVWGVFMVFALPDNQITARFLNDREKIVAVERMRSEQTGIENKKFKLYQVKEALVDPKTWIMFGMTFCIHFVNGSVSGFGSIIVNSFGYPHLKSILLVGATGACVVVTLIIAGLIGTYVRNVRTILMAVVEIPVIIGSALVWKMDWETSRGAAIAGFILLGCFAAAYMMMLAVLGANTAGHTKKAFTSGLIWCAWGISNGVAPLTIKSSEAHEHYPTCFKATIATAFITIFGSVLLRAYLQGQNSVRDRKFGKVDASAALSAAFHDQTDMENKYFRYSL